MALWLCSLFQFPQRRIAILHTSLYALPPYSQAVRASSPGMASSIATNPYGAVNFSTAACLPAYPPS